MKKKKIIIISSIVAAVLLLSAIIGVIIYRKNTKKVNLSTRDIYAMSAATSVAYLSDNDGASQTGDQGSGLSGILPVASKPSNLTDGDVTGIYNCISMFDTIVSGGGIDQTNKANSSTDDLLKTYAFEMTIALPNGSGKSTLCTMYFNEINTQTEKELDDGVEEVEVSTTFEGVIVYGNEKFIVKGVRKVETEGSEVEKSIEFKTYKNSSQTGVEADLNNYVVVEQSVENGEIEYEYTFYKDGNKVQDIELEYEQRKNGVEIEFQLKDLSNDTLNETVFKIKKGNDSDELNVWVYKNNKKDKITIKKLENGAYKFNYSNGASETIPSNA